MVTSSNDSDLGTAREAMRRWTAGAATGDWSALLAMFDPDVTFHVPVTGFEGIQHGVEAARRFFDHVADIIRAALHVDATFANGAQVGFEVAVRGTLHGEPFQQRLCIVFDVHDGAVRGFREYLAWPGGLHLPDAA
jgi:ketosteroid isomerase-like protein